MLRSNPIITICLKCHIVQQFSDYKSCCSLNNIIFHNYLILLILLLNLEVSKILLATICKKNTTTFPHVFFTQKYKLRSHNISVFFQWVSMVTTNQPGLPMELGFSDWWWGPTLIREHLPGLELRTRRVFLGYFRREGREWLTSHETGGAKY